MGVLIGIVGFFVGLSIVQIQAFFIEYRIVSYQEQILELENQLRDMTVRGNS